MTLRLERLTPSHDVEAFSAGSAQPRVTAFLQEEARLEEKLGLAQVWVALDPGGAIAGYLALAPISIPVSASVTTALGFPRPLGLTVRGYQLARIGIDERFTGQRLGDALDACAIRVAEDGAARGEGMFISVEARSDALREWYAELGYVQLSEESDWMVRSTLSP